jgi:hypothetical protein
MPSSSTQGRSVEDTKGTRVQGAHDSLHRLRPLAAASLLAFSTRRVLRNAILTADKQSYSSVMRRRNYPEPTTKSSQLQIAGTAWSYRPRLVALRPRARTREQRKAEIERSRNAALLAEGEMSAHDNRSVQHYMSGVRSSPRSDLLLRAKDGLRRVEDDHCTAGHLWLSAPHI